MNLPDWTTFYQLGIFLLSIVVLHNLLFKPMLRVFEARENAFLQPKSQAEQYKSESEALQNKIQSSIQQARDEADKIKTDILKRTALEEAAIVAKAKADALETVNLAKAELENQILAAKSRLESEVGSLANSLATKLLSIGIRRQP